MPHFLTFIALFVSFIRTVYLQMRSFAAQVTLLVFIALWGFVGSQTDLTSGILTKFVRVSLLIALTASFVQVDRKISVFCLCRRRYLKISSDMLRQTWLASQNFFDWILKNEIDSLVNSFRIGLANIVTNSIVYWSNISR